MPPSPPPSRYSFTQLEEVATAYLRQENFQTLRDFSPARAKKLFDYLAANTDSPWRPPSKLRDVQVLIIDEIFLASSLTFTMIVTICQGVRDNFTEPFGGLSVLLVGDPLQGTSIGSDENCLTRRCGWSKMYVPTLRHLPQTTCKRTKAATS